MSLFCQFDQVPFSLVLCACGSSLESNRNFRFQFGVLTITSEGPLQHALVAFQADKDAYLMYQSLVSRDNFIVITSENVLEHFEVRIIFTFLGLLFMFILQICTCKKGRGRRLEQ